jgi:hypothetical protein
MPWKLPLEKLKKSNTEKSESWRFRFVP